MMLVGDSLYSVQKCLYPRQDGPAIDGWVIIHTELYPFWPNKYLHQMNMGSPQTARQYAYKLCKYLNYLHDCWHIGYADATAKHLTSFLRFLQFGNVIPYGSSIKGQRSGHTVRNYCTVVTGFYTYLRGQGKAVAMEPLSEKTSENPYSYLYGQGIVKSSPKYVVDSSFVTGKPPVDYEKWYTDEQVDAILSNFRTYRDKAVFSLSLDGLRIDEILSAQIDLYRADEGTLKLFRSKGRREGEGRVCVLSERSRRLLEEYLYNERSAVEAKLIDSGALVPTEIFLNLRERADSFGKPMAYHNALEIIKRAAKHAGLDPAKVRTHSGRSTKMEELLRQQSLDPASLTDNQILDIMGWKSMESAEPYKNRQDRVTAVENWKRLEAAKERRHADDQTT